MENLFFNWIKETDLARVRFFLNILKDQNYFANWSMPRHKPKHKLEKWFIISGDGVRPSVCLYVRMQN